MDRTPTRLIRTPYGDILISTSEATAFDLVQYVHRSGHLSNVATVLAELAEKLDPKKLVAAAKACGEITVTQRLGYLLDSFAEPKLTANLHVWLEKSKPMVTSLRPNWKPPKRPKTNSRWQLVVNETVEPDV